MLFVYCICYYLLKNPLEIRKIFLKKITKRLLLSGFMLTALLFLTGCVKTKNGKPTGDGFVYTFLVKPMSAAVEFFAHNLGFGFGIAIIFPLMFEILCLLNHRSLNRKVLTLNIICWLRNRSCSALLLCRKLLNLLV